MSLWVFGIAIIGGFLAYYALTYPLYYYYPGIYIANWHSLIDSQISLFMLILAVIFIILSGAFAARWSNLPGKKGSALAGSIAGVIAILFTYGSVISPAIGVWANRDILLSEFQPVTDNDIFLEMIVDAVTSSILGDAFGMIALVGIGIILGGLGGVFIKAKKPDQSGTWPKISIVSSAFGLLFSFFIFIISLVTLTFLGETILKSAQEMNKSFAYSPTTVIFIKNLSLYVMIVFWQLILWRSLKQREALEDDMHLSWVLASLAAFGIPILLALAIFLTSRSSYFFLACSLGSILLGFFTFRDTFWTKRKRKLAPPLNLLERFPILFKLSMILGIFVIIFLLLSNTTLALNIVMITVVAISYITPEGATSIVEVDTINKTVNTLYQLNFVLTFWVGLGIIIYLLLIFWTIRNLLIFMNQHGAELLTKLQRASTAKTSQ